MAVVQRAAECSNDIPLLETEFVLVYGALVIHVRKIHRSVPQRILLPIALGLSC